MRLGVLLLDLLFPPKCAFCGKILEQPRAVMCPECQRELPWLEGSRAEHRVEFASLCVSPLGYQDRVRESIHRYKFSGCRCFCKTYGVLTAQCVQDYLDGMYDLISWVPVSGKRRRERGYDQAYLLARETARCLERETVPLLEKIKDNPAQSGVGEAAARRANVMGVYRVLDPERVRGKRVLLVDDVVTTGETLSECARMLVMAGAWDVVCVALARAGQRTGGENGRVLSEMCHTEEK